ncbi:hypothetical protein D3C77_631060 [compost metagenome]
MRSAVDEQNAATLRFSRSFMSDQLQPRLSLAGIGIMQMVGSKENQNKCETNVASESKMMKLISSSSGMSCGVASCLSFRALF